MKVGINGMGRIGRLALRAAFGAAERPADDPRGGNRLEVVHLNEIKGGAAATAHLLAFDSVQGRWREDIEATGPDAIRVGGRTLSFSEHAAPGEIPWGDLGVDLVLECTGKFLTPETLQGHLDRGARRVIVAAPVKVGDVLNVVVGVNDHLYDPAKHRIVTAASCTTNCLAPIAKILEDNFGIVKGYMTTVHAYTNDQVTLDAPHKAGIDSRRGRAAAANIVPSTTGAAKAVGLVLPSLKGKLDGIALRVPVITGSIVDLVVELKKNVTVAEVNAAVKAAQSPTVGYTEDPIVSTDVIGIKNGTLFDARSTKIMEVDGKQLVKVLSWYDNESSFTAQMIRSLKYFAQLI